MQELELEGVKADTNEDSVGDGKSDTKDEGRQELEAAEVLVLLACCTMYYVEPSQAFHRYHSFAFMSGLYFSISNESIGMILYPTVRCECCGCRADTDQANNKGDLTPHPTSSQLLGTCWQWDQNAIKCSL